MSMRKVAMQRSHRKSISEKDINTKPTDLNGTYIKELSISSGKTKSKRSKGKKGKSKDNKNKTIEKENDLPLAQSTMINDSKLDTVTSSPKTATANVQQKANQTFEVPAKSDGKTTNEKETNNNNTSTSKKQNLKMSPQEAVDQVLEYKYKYERLCGIFEQFKEQHTMLLTNFQTQMTENKEMKGKLTNDLYTLEAEKFSLQEDLEKIKTENNELKEKLTKIETPDSGENKTNTSGYKADASFTNVPCEPQPLCRSRRKSMLNVNISSVVKDDSERCSFYEDIILDQQEILDFYSLLCATSICKQTNPPSAEEEDDDVTPTEVKYSCKMQLKNHPLDGYPFDFCLNYGKQELEYIPSPTTDNDQYKQYLPCNLQTGKTYNVDQGCLFSKDLALALDKTEQEQKKT